MYITVGTVHPQQRATPLRWRTGQGLVETALVLPILLMILFSILDFSYYFFTAISVNNSTRIATRRAMMNNITRDQIKDLVVSRAVGTLVSTSSVTITTIARDPTRVQEGEPPTVEILTEYDHRFWAIGYIGINSLKIKSNFKSVVVTDPDHPLITF